MFFGCESETKTVTVKREAYSVDLPDFLSETNMLNEEASLQYQNLLKQFFVVVLDEPKGDLETALQDSGLDYLYSADLRGYSELVVNNFKEHLKLDSIPDFTETTVNGLKALTLDMTGVVDGEAVYWKMVYLEGKNNYYQLFVWTIDENKEKYQKDMQAVVDSFKETDKSKK